MLTMLMASIYMLPTRIVNDFYKRNQLLNYQYGLNEKYRVAHTIFYTRKGRNKMDQFYVKASNLLLIYYF